MASEHKSQFVSSMSHELRTPLNAIIGLTEMMVTNAARFGTEKAAEPLQRVHRAGTHLLGLINQVLDLSKIEAGKLELNPQTVQLAPLIDEVIGTARQLAEQNKNRLVVDAQENLGTLTVDPMRLRQILLNLLSNACKFTKEGEVKLQARSGGRRTRLDRARRRRHRHRHDGGAAGEAVRGIHPGRRRDRAALRWHRARPRHHPQARAHDGRRRHSGERSGQRLGLYGAPARKRRQLTNDVQNAAEIGANLLQRVKTRLALFCRASRANPCPVSGVKQPCRRNLETAQFGPHLRHGPDYRGPFPRHEKSARFCLAALEAGHAEILAEERAASVPSAGTILSARSSSCWISLSMPRISVRSDHSLRGSYAMTRHVLFKIAAMMVSAAAIGASPAYAQTSTGQITVLYDAFGKTSTMKKDWGFSALIEYGGKRILFDTGNNAEIFAHNVEAKGIDLRQLDFAVVSHRHGDHTSGLNHLLKVNPAVKIYAPQESFGVFGAALPGSFYRRNESSSGHALFRRETAGDASFRQPVA